jgi:hypothetical protein
MLASGAWNLSPVRTKKLCEPPAMRYVKFRDHLRDLERQHGNFTAVYYELVMRHMATLAAHIYGAFEGALHTYCHEHEPQIVPEGIHVQTVKKYALGHGATAVKPVVSAQTKWPDQNVPADGHDQADALWVLEVGMIPRSMRPAKQRKTKPPPEPEVAPQEVPFGRA